MKILADPRANRSSRLWRSRRLAALLQTDASARGFGGGHLRGRAAASGARSLGGGGFAGRSFAGGGAGALGGGQGLPGSVGGPARRRERQQPRPAGQPRAHGSGQVRWRLCEARAPLPATTLSSPISSGADTPRHDPASALVAFTPCRPTTSLQPIPPGGNDPASAGWLSSPAAQHQPAADSRPAARSSLPPGGFHPPAAQHRPAADPARAARSSLRRVAFTPCRPTPACRPIPPGGHDPTSAWWLSPPAAQCRPATSAAPRVAAGRRRPS